MGVVKPRWQRRAEARERRLERAAQQREKREQRTRQAAPAVAPAPATGNEPLAAETVFEEPQVSLAEALAQIRVPLALPSAGMVLEAAWLLIALVVPLLFWPAGRDSYELPKQTAVRIVLYLACALAGACGLFRWASMQGQTGSPSSPRWQARLEALLRWPPAWVAAAIALAWTLATLFSVAPLVSLFGTTNRWAGLRSEITLTILFLIAAAQLRRPSQLRRLALATAVTGTLVALYALAQKAGIQSRWVIAGGLPATIARPFSTLGNPIFLADYGLLASFLVLGGLLSETGRVRRWLWLGALFMQLLLVILPQSRGSWVAVAGGFVLLVMHLANLRGIRARYWLGGPAAAAGIAAAGLVLGQGLLRTLGLARLADLANPGEGAAQSRLLLWQSGLRLWLDRPVTGFGPDTFESVIERRMPHELLALSPPGDDVVYDRAHNAVVDALVMVGGLGALAFLLVLCVLGWHLWRLHRHYRMELEAAALLSLPKGALTSQAAMLTSVAAGVAAYLVAQQFSIQTVTSSSLFWLLNGALIAQARYATTMSVDGGGRPASPERMDRARKVSGGRWVLAVAGAAAAGLVALGVSAQELRPIQARLADDEGVAAHREQRLDIAVAREERATALWPFSYRHWSELAYARRALARSKSGSEGAESYREAVEAVQRTREINPVYPRVLAYFGDVAGEAAARAGDATLGEQAVQAHMEATSTAPFTWRYREMAGQTLVQLGRFAEAKEQFARAVSLWDSNWALWAAYGDSAILSGDRETARVAYERALRLNPSHEGVQRALAALGAR